MMKLYVGATIYPRRRHIFPLLKPFEKSDEYSDSIRQAHYGISEKDVVFVDTIALADFVVLPMSWNYYLSNGSLQAAIDLVQNANQHHKTVLSFMIGDFGVAIPEFEHVVVFRHSGNKSKLPSTHKGLPAFIDDPVVNMYDQQTIDLRPYTNRPTIGFCGQANGNLWNASREVVATAFRNLRTRLGFSNSNAQSLLSSSYLRAKVLYRLSKNDAMHSNFILRKQYRAGAITAAARQKTTQEFYDNMRDSDYVVCVRGAGNFSVRLYETLAMGRIPIFVDTDCLVPLEDSVDWKKHMVWVAYQDRKHIAEKVLAFHQGLTASAFEALQLKNRALWKEQLTLGGFFKHYLKKDAN